MSGVGAALSHAWGPSSGVRRTAGSGVHVDPELLDKGGRHWGVWQRMTPPAPAWLDGHGVGAGAR